MGVPCYLNSIFNLYGVERLLSVWVGSCDCMWSSQKVKGEDHDGGAKGGQAGVERYFGVPGSPSLTDAP